MINKFATKKIKMQMNHISEFETAGTVTGLKSISELFYT